MSVQAAPASVRRAVTVSAPPLRAFGVFTEAFHTWWPQSHHIGKAEMATAVMEPRAGGRWYERGIDDSECEWGRVLAWEPPTRLLLAWHINEQWQYDPDPNHASEIEVRFIADGPGLTRVELEHRHFERHGAGGPTLRSAVDSDSDGGWGLLLERYAKAVGA